MPIFINDTARVLVIVPHKCGFSSFSDSDDFEFISLKAPDVSIIIRYTIKNYKIYQIYRNPINRIISTYKDKFRMVPTWINASNFFWPYLNNVYLEHFGISKDASNEEKAAFCLSITFDQFLETLPMFYQRDPHTWPQTEFGKHKLSKNFELTFPRKTIVQLESIASHNIPGFDVGKKVHSSEGEGGHFQPSQAQLKMLYGLYQEDFKAGGYPVPKI